MATTDPYASLGVSRTASVDEIKKAYRKLARRYHPDVNPGDKASEERFKEVSEANEILSDPAKRKTYDEFGMDGLRAGFDPERARAYQDFQTRPTQGSAEGFGGYGRFEDILGDLVGERMQSGPQPGADTEAVVEIDFLDAVRGASRSVTIDRSEPCAQCGGSGNDASSETSCPECQGSGRLKVGQGPVNFSRLCPRCRGIGRIALRSCQKCGGAGQTARQEHLNIHIPAGVDSGSRVRVAGKGMPGRAGAAAGDLYLVVKVRPHPLLERRGENLYLDVPIKVGEALSGASITVPTPSGEVRVKVPAGSQSGKLLRVRGRGVPALKGGATGDLYLRVMVHVPGDGADRVVEAARVLDDAYADDPRRGLRL